MVALNLMELQSVRVIKIPPTAVVVVGSVVVEVSFAGEGLITYGAVIGGGLSASSARHHQ
jgi:hypothetical protein